MPSSTDSILKTFDGFRADFDDHNDRRERLIKSSRDITNLSKKVIFLLHRLITTRIADSGDSIDFKSIAREGREKLTEIQPLFARFKEDVEGHRYWRYQTQVSPGLQEYIEALSFTHFLEYGTLITFGDVAKTLVDSEDKPIFPLPVEEYLLGVSDLTGELMRFAITAISRRGGRKKAKEVCDFVRNCYADFESFTPHMRNLRKKQSVTGQSLLKIEKAAYRLAVRTSEYRDYELSDEMVENYVDGVIADEGGNRAHPRERGDEDENVEDSEND